MTPEDFIRRHTDCGLCEYPPDMHEALDHLKRRIAELEARPALAWSTEPPVKQGNYLARIAGDDDPRGWWLIYWKSYETPGDEATDNEYAGPIPEPAEPGDEKPLGFEPTIGYEPAEPGEVG